MIQFNLEKIQICYLYNPKHLNALLNMTFMFFITLTFNDTSTDLSPNSELWPATLDSD